MLESLNTTELYQLCLKAGLRVPPGASREQLGQYLTGALLLSADEAQNHPIDAWRDALIGFLLDHWDVVQPQLKCPARYLKSPDPEKVNQKPCFGCHDLQVMACIAENPKNLDRIRLYQVRKSK